MMRCATTAAARAIDSRIGGSLDNRSSAAAAAAGGIPVDPRMGPSVSEVLWIYYTHTHRHPFNGPLSRTTQVSRYQKGKTNLDFTEARDSELQWHQLGHMQVCTSLQTDDHASTPPLSFLHAECPSCRPTNSVKALKALCALNLL